MYNLGLFLKTAYLSVFKARKTPARWTIRRLIFLIGFYILWPLYGIIIQLCFLLDDIFYPANKEQPVRRPLFILGPYRTGSTFLFRTIAKDTKNFTCTHTWELFLAPSIIQRKFVMLLGRVDRFFGGHLKRWFTRLDEDSLGEIPQHKNSMLSPEEDENILFHCWSTFHIWFMFPFPDDLPNYYAFDRDIPKKHRRRVMRFYKRCVQRHLRAHGGRAIYLSKSPAFSAKIESLNEWFPDANFVFLARNPLNVLPSTISWWRTLWTIFGNPPMNYPFTREIFNYTQHWFKDGLKKIKQVDPQRRMIVKYNDLVADPFKAISGIYEKFDYDLHEEFRGILQAAQRRERSYRSRHRYHYGGMGFSRKEIVEGFSEVFEEFGFDRGA